MSDTERDPTRPDGERPEVKAPLSPARPVSRAKPVSARAMAEIDGAPAPLELVAEEVCMTVAGTEWRATVLGRAGDPGQGKAPLLLLGFQPVASDDQSEMLQAMVVGRSLDAFTEDAFERALATAKKPRPMEERSGKSSRGDGRDRTRRR